MSLISWIIIAVVVSFFAWKFFAKYQNSKEYEKILLNLPTQWGGWIELSDTDLKPLMYGKVLFSSTDYIVGVGALVKEQLPTMLVSDIDTKIQPELLDNGLPICRFVIDPRGQEVVLSEFKNSSLKNSLKPYVDEYSKIKLIIGFQSDEYILFDYEESKKEFEEIWELVMLNHELQ